MFENSRLKWKRADWHIQEINTGLEAFLQSGALKLVAVTEPNDMQVIKVVADPAPPTAAFALIIGDAVHNLRSALDHLTSEVGRSIGNGLKLHFPMHQTEINLKDLLDGPIFAKMEGRYPGFCDLILNRIKPFKHSDPCLWHIGHFDNIDKHNLIIPFINVSGFDGVCYHNSRSWNMGLHLAVHGNGVCRATADQAPDPYVITEQGRPTAELLFPGGKELRGFSVRSVLTKLAEETARTIDEFDRFFAAKAGP
jgi:hypothetical protein